jgi:hypothetical protein
MNPKIKELINNSSKAIYAKPVNVAEIRIQESKLGLQFGSQYLDFLKEYGCLVVGPNEIYGICGKNDAVPSAVHATLSVRKDKNFPKNLLVIAEDGKGVSFCVDSKDAIFTFERGTITALNENFEEFANKWISFAIN